MKNNLKTYVVGFVGAISILLTGCAAAPPLTDAGARTRPITPGQAKECKFVRTIQYNDRIYSLGKDPTVMRAIGETNLRNKVGAANANSYVVKKNDSNWFMGSVSYEAEAYICP